MSEPLKIKEEYQKAKKWTSDTLLAGRKQPEQELSNSSVTDLNISYRDVVRELLLQVDNGCDIIPIDLSFSYEDLMDWVKAHAKGNRVIIINDSLKCSTGQVLAVTYAQDNMLLLGQEMPKVCFVYIKLNPSIQDLFPEGVKVYVKPFKFV